MTSLKVEHLATYRGIASLLIKYGRTASDWSEGEGGDSGLDPDEAERDAEKLTRDLENMGPTFVKLGQLLSTRADLLPKPYMDALSRLQEEVEPFPFDQVREIIEAQLKVRLSNAFKTFDEKPLAAASLGQVHRAEMRDGRMVAVKVQRPGVRVRVADDMGAIATIAELADNHTDAGQRFGFVDMVEEFRRSILGELDYRQEARNLEVIGDNLAHNKAVVVPQPVADFSTDTVLTMDFVPGRSLGSISGLGLTEVDGPALASTLFSVYLDQVLVDGVFHADPHPGNLLITDDGRLGLIDLGMVARVAPETQDSLIKLLLAISEGDGHGAAHVAVSLGRKLDHFDNDRFVSAVADLVGRNQTVTVGDIEVGVLVGELTRISGDCGLRMPSEMTLLGKTLLNLDDTARRLDPNFDPNAAIRAQAARLLERKFTDILRPGNIISVAAETLQFAEHLPSRVNRVMDALAEGQIKLKIEGIDEDNIMRGVQKLANRVTTGVVIAALLIGAALIMSVPTKDRLFGYPALAIVLFLAAAAAAVWMLFTIFWRERPDRKPRL